MLEYIIKQSIKQKVQTPQDLARIKREGCSSFKQRMPSDIQLLKVYHNLVKKRKIRKNKKLEDLLKTREIRTSSGVAIVTVLTKPWPCPGQCLYCPSEPDMPKSYLKNEPAAQRAYLAKFDPFLQVKIRLSALAMTGHPTDKIELIVLGGTWSAYPKKYQYWFIMECFRAANAASPKFNPPAGGQSSKLQPKIQNLRIQLKTEQKKNESAKHRIIGLTLETRPDFINLVEIETMHDLGCTRVELGVQSVYDDVLQKNQRGHNIGDIIQATKLLKNAGFKINYHIMLNLPGSNLHRDEKMFDVLFTNPDFQPDLLKIYPCIVLKTAPLYKLWQRGGYQPYSEKQLINLVLRIKEKVPPYVRIQRIIRDIPGKSIMAGSKLTNLRQIIDNSGKKKCRCIRCREVRGQYSPSDKIKLFRRDYKASGGKEIFLSLESPRPPRKMSLRGVAGGPNQKKLYALLRLRIPATDAQTLPVLKNAALIRELHTYGHLMSIRVERSRGAKQKNTAQHTGLGKKLMAEAEKIVKNETDLKRIAVISGVGVRRYYKKLGYRLKNEYMIKRT